MNLSIEATVPVVRVCDASFYYGLRPIVQQVAFEIPPGQRVVLIGPNGAGKTTLMHALAGVLTPVIGTVEIFGQVRRSSVAAERAIRRQCYYLPDDCWFPPELNLLEYLAGIGRLYEVPLPRLIDHSQKLLSLFGMESIARQPMTHYSAGQKKKAALCGAILSDCPLLLLDEPFSGGLDPAGIYALQSVLQQFSQTTKQHAARTLVFSTPVPEVVEATADRVLIVRDGVIAGDHSIAELKQRVDHEHRFADILQQLVFPDAAERIARYLESEK
jgi:ABC-type multidrug transport system ATPase subunit